MRARAAGARQARRGTGRGAVADGAAGRNGGFLLAGLTSFYHDAVRDIGRERAHAIYRLTMQEIERMCAEAPAAVRRVGSLRIADSAAEALDCDAQYDAMRADGLPVERYKRAGGRALFLPTDGAFQPVTRCRALALGAVAGGALLIERSPAVAITGTDVVTPHGRVRCRRVVVAVDGAMAAVLPELAHRVRATRLQMLATAPRLK